MPRARGWHLVLIGVIVLAGLAWGARLAWKQAASPVEVGIFLGTSDRSWADFVYAVELAAEELELPVSVDWNDNLCRVMLDSEEVVFRWYPESGSRNIQFRIRELCETKPPIALVGANNSAMTNALVEELASNSTSRETPVLLMTYGTADYLIDGYRERSFRVGFNNSYQARTVVDRLAAYYRAKMVQMPKLNVVLVQVLDDPFSVDLAKKFEDQLANGFDATFISSPHASQSSLKTSRAWNLQTCTGGFNMPNDEEKRLAEDLVRRMAAEPDSQWALVLPVGTGSFRRISIAIGTALAEFPQYAVVEKARQNLIILSGDSMNHYTFKEPERSFLEPEKTPAPVILFAHVHPEDKTVVQSPDNHIPARGLNRDVARALLSVLREPENRRGPDELARALEKYTTQRNRIPFFADHERREGGGAILVEPVPGEYKISLPPQWQSN